MNPSPYLAQALQALGQAPQTQQPAIDPAMLAQVMQQRKMAAAQPGQAPIRPSIGHSFGQAAQNVQALPQRIGAIPANMAGNLQQAGQNVMGAPGRLAGLFSLGGR